jgi:acyl-CoA dehydrogenase
MSIQSDAGLTPFTEEEEMYRASVRSFLDHELEPYIDKFVGNLDYERQFFRKAGGAGILGSMIPEEYGGPGAGKLCGVVLMQELGRSIGGATIGSSISNDIATHLLMYGGSDELKRRWAPAIMSGEAPQCMPMTEPGAGSDIGAIRTTAIRDGDSYVINGSKIYISNGNKASLLYVVAKTDPKQRSRGLSVFLVEANSKGVSRRPMKTMGFDAYDLAEFHFDNVRVPAGNLFLGEGRALDVLMSTFPLDHLELSARALGEAELAFKLALDFVKQRKVSGQTVFEFQNTQFKLAEMKTEIEVGRSFVHDGVRKYRSGNYGVTDGAMIKLWTSEMSSRVIDNAFQMFGGAGFMDEMPISKLYRCNRLYRIYAGTSEIQKATIAKRL